MAMTGGFLRSRNCLRTPLANAGRSHKQCNALNAIPRRERGEVQAELVSIWEQPTKGEAVAQLAAFKAKYSKRYSEAVRSLAGMKSTSRPFTPFLLPCTDTFRAPMPLKVSLAI